MKYINPKLTEEQRSNLRKLADFLDSGVSHIGFDMRNYLTSDDIDLRINEVEYKCNSVACAVGHGPLAGIKIKYDKHWRSYSDRVFGYHIYDWCFHSIWFTAKIDNTIEGCVKRINIVLNKGIPIFKEFMKHDVDDKFRRTYHNFITNNPDASTQCFMKENSCIESECSILEEEIIMETDSGLLEMVYQ